MFNLPKTVKFAKITIALGIIAYFLVSQSGKLISDQNVRASGDLLVTFEVAPLFPLFNEPNFMPGDSVTKWVKVKNNGASDRLVAVRAHNVVLSEPPPYLPEVLTLVIIEGSTEIYRNSLENFFGLSSRNLSHLAPGVETTYYFTVSMNFDANNDYQKKQVVFDLTFGCECEEPPTGGCGWNITAQNIGNGAGSVNTILINISRKFSLVQNNSGSVNNDVNININTGENSGGSGQSGSSSVLVEIKNKLNKNIARWRRR